MSALLNLKRIRCVFITVLVLLSLIVRAEETTVTKKQEPYLEGVYPVYPTTKKAETPAQNAVIARGEYLAKMGDCISCHTNTKENGKPYAGGLALDTPFGTFYTPNITPDKETGIGNWSEKDLIRALKEGKDPHGRNYFPVFPYIYFSKITDADAKAIYAYLMSIPAVKQTNKALPFPFGVPGARFSLLGWNLLFFYPGDEPIKYDSSHTPAWNQGKYLVDGLGHCSMCHTPLNLLGAPKTKYYLTGGFIDGYWAPNITHYGLASATVEQVAEVFSKGQLINNAGPVAGPMAEVNHNSLSYMTLDDQIAIATYLKTVKSQEPMGLSGSEEQPTIQRGKQVYLRACVVCHQAGQMTAPLQGDAGNWYLRLKSSGLTGLYQHVIQGYNSMPVRGGCVTCSDNDIIAAVDYILNNALTRAQWIDLAKGGSTKYPGSDKTVYQKNCAICHAEGKNGAPKTGDKVVWKPLIAKNMDVLIQNALHGASHPKQTTCKQCSTDEVIEAVKYMVGQSTTDGNYSLW